MLRIGLKGGSKNETERVMQLTHCDACASAAISLKAFAKNVTG
jgi:hypothetical protein